MIKIMAELTEDRSKVRKIISFNTETELPLEQRFDAQMVGRLIDITDLDPRPQEMWTYDGTKFNAPVKVSPTIPELLNQLTRIETAYIATHYSPLVQQAFNLYYVDARKAVDSPGKALIEKTWDWGQSIGVYAQTIAQEIMTGQRTDLSDVDFAARFDASDPQVLLIVKDDQLEVILASDIQPA